MYYFRIDSNFEKKKKIVNTHVFLKQSLAASPFTLPCSSDICIIAFYNFVVTLSKKVQLTFGFLHFKIIVTPRVTINKKDRSDFYCGRCFELESYLVAKVHENAIFQDPPYEKIHSLAATAALLWMVKMYTYRYSRVIKFLRNFEFRNCARNERWADVA